MPQFLSIRSAQHYRAWGVPIPPPVQEPVYGWPRDRSCPSGIAIVGEGPGQDEDQFGVPFVGRSGAELDRFLTTYHVNPDNCFITNIGRIFRPGNPDPTAEDIAIWEYTLHEELNVAKPTTILAIGRISTRYFLGDVDMDAVHGVPFHCILDWLDNRRGGRVVIIPIVHPAAGMHNTEAQALTSYDFAQMDAFLRGRLKPRDPDTADKHPNPVYLDLNDYDLVTIDDSLGGGSASEPLHVAIDTEGVPGQPWGLSYSHTPGTAYVIRKVHPLALRAFYEALTRGIRQGRIHVLLHNSLHDLRVLRELGIPLPDGSYTDTMVLAYNLCVEPQGLKTLAYRHCGMEMLSYDEIVSDAADRIAVQYYETMEAVCSTEAWSPLYDTWAITCPGDTDINVEMVASTPELVREGGFPIIEPYTILERDKSTGQLRERIKKPQQISQRVARALNEYRTGKLTAAGLRKRWYGTDDLIADTVEAMIGEMREPTLDDVPLERAINYAARDADATVRIYPHLLALHRALAMDRIAHIDHAIIPMVDRMQAVGIPVDVDYFRWLSQDLARRALDVQQKIKAQFGVWINPNSGEQVADLLFRPTEEGGYGLIPTKQTRGRLDKETGEYTGKRGSTVDKVLEGMRDAHPIVPMILEYRGLNKAKTSFADVVVRRARKGEDGLWWIHCLFRVTRVSSGRMSATGPNLMAIMGGDLGMEIRMGYIAGKGYQFSEWDLSQIEMRGMASESGDEFLISMFMNDEDVHTGTASKMFKYNLPRPYNKKQLKGYVLPGGYSPRDPAKRTGFGIITGITAKGLVDQMRLQGIEVSEEDAKVWIEEWLAACPAVPRYMQECHGEARRYGFVRDWAGRIRYLPGIRSPFRGVRAEAGRQSHSHKIQSGAQSIMKIAMATIWTQVLPYWWERGKYIEPILQIHDALMFRHKGFDSQELSELDGQIRAALFSAAPPEFRVPLDAGCGHADCWGLLDH